jgi:hypothetical protein
MTDAKNLVAVSQEEGPVILSPDDTDVHLIMNAVLPTCPCCLGTPTTFMRLFERSGIYQGYVHCSRCDVQVFKNARNKDEARDLAIAAWSKRPTPSGEGEEIARLRAAVLAVVAATRAYLPPDGIDAKECINRILEATDNPAINPFIAATEAHSREEG